MNGLRKLDVKKGAGPDQIPTSFLKEYADELSKPLLLLFNESMETGIFADCWKLSFLSPIFKSGDRSKVENYRGVAGLNSIPKLLEKLVTDKLTPSIVKHLHSSQHGFRNGKSTTTNLVCLTDMVLNSLRTNIQIDAVYTDFRKAFDRVNHRVLIKKLQCFGINGSLLQWLQSYVTGRVQRVKLGETTSHDIFVHSGVTQGSHLGPLLFLIFIDDLHYHFSSCEAVAYADDFKLCKIVNCTNDANDLQRDLDRMVDWCNNNLMQLNVDKCEFITFSRKSRECQIDF